MVVLFFGGSTIDPITAPKSLYISTDSEFVQVQGPSHSNDFLISGAISLFLSPIVIILISEGSGPEPNYPDDTSYFHIGPAFIFFWLLFAIIGTIILFIISLVIRAVQGPNDLYSNYPPSYDQRQRNLQPTSGISNQERYQTLEKLDSMRDKGIISEEEFQKEKDRILNS